MKTPSSKSSSGARRAIRFVIKGALGLVALTAVYIAVPAVTNMSGMATIFGMPFVEQQLGEIGLTPADVKRGAYFSSFAVQSAATLVSVMSGFSINTSYGDSWSVPDSVLRAIKTPGAGTNMVVVTSCSSRERTTSVLVTIAQPGYSARDALKSISGEGRIFKPDVPLKVRENFSILESGALVQALYSQPQFFWRFPRLGFFRDKTSRRAEVKELYPDMDRPDCANDGSTALTLSESIGRIEGLEGLGENWKNPQYKFPEGVNFSAVNIGGKAGKVVIAPENGTLRVTVTHSGELAHEAMLLQQSALRATFEKQGPLHFTVHLHSDGRRRADSETYKLRDGKVSMSSNKDGVLNTLFIRYTPD